METSERSLIEETPEGMRAGGCETRAFLPPCGGDAAARRAVSKQLMTFSKRLEAERLVLKTLGRVREYRAPPQLSAFGTTRSTWAGDIRHAHRHPHCIPQHHPARAWPVSDRGSFSIPE